MRGWTFRSKNPGRAKRGFNSGRFSSPCAIVSSSPRRARRMAGGTRRRLFPACFSTIWPTRWGRRKTAHGVFSRARAGRTAAAALDAEATSQTRVHLREYDLENILKQIHRPAPGSLSYMNDFSGFARRRGALSERWRREVLTAYDGMFTAPDLRELIRERIHSPARPVGITRVEVFFGCPYRFINDRLHPRMEKRREPAPPFAMDGMLRGELTHRVLEEFPTAGFRR